jgi:hypothetical protein
MFTGVKIIKFFIADYFFSVNWTKGDLNVGIFKIVFTVKTPSFGLGKQLVLSFPVVFIYSSFLDYLKGKL